MKHQKRMLFFTFTLTLLLALTGCGDISSKNKLTILSGSENKELESIIAEYESKNHVDIEMIYKGSVDIMQELQKDNITYDAVWPANSLWIAMGDKNHVVKHQKSIMTTPVVFGIKKSVAKELGFTDKQVSVRDILKAIEEKKLTFTMTSASQSNSGASAYIGFIYSLLGNPEIIKKEDLHNEAFKKEIKALLSGINRSSGSSEWLKELFLNGNYDAMVNYEALIISTNQELIKQGKEPLYVVYPYDGLTIADSPLGYVNKSNEKKEEQFLKFQQYLLSEEVQSQLLNLGRRTGIGGSAASADQNIFNPDWGIDTQKILSPIKMPAAEVIMEALTLYQTEYKKPSMTVFCLDYSGSMKGEGEEQMKEAMTLLLDQEKAKQYFLQASKEDEIIIIPFSDAIKKVWEFKGNSEEELLQAANNISQLEIGGGTDIYTPAMEALKLLGAKDLSNYSPAVILMTDGESNTGNTFEAFKQVWEQNNKDIPVFSIMFGEASEDQLKDIADLTRARVFDGKKDLIEAFKKAKGYN